MTYILYSHVLDSSNNNPVLLEQNAFIHDWELFLKEDCTKFYYIWENDIFNEFSKSNGSSTLNIEDYKIDDIIKHDIKVILDISTGAINFHSYSKILEFIDTSGIDHANIFILLNTPVEVDKISSIFEKDKKPSIIYTGRNEILFICDVLSQRRPKKFLFLCRRWTIDRFFTFLDLRRRNILDNSIYSFSLSSNPYGFTPSYVDEAILDGSLISHVESYGKTNPYANDIVDYWFATKHDILNEIPRSLGDIFKDQYNSSIVDAFNSTYMSLCVETASMLSDGMHFQPSEKIYKCCYHRHPFVVYTTPKFLSYWKDSNYKSFSSIINEDYDNKWNCIERTQFINDEIQKLNEMPFQHFHKLTTWTCASELTHNQIEIVRKFGDLSAKNYPTNNMVQDIFTKTPLDYNPNHIS